MKTKIVVDSASSLYALKGVDFACVPLKIITDDAEYLDDGTLDAVGMARALRTYKGKTSTSCPNVSDWLAAYEGADEVYAITITGTLSGSYNAAQLAAEEYQQENPGKRVFVLDSLSTGPEQYLLAEHLQSELAAGHEFDAVCEEMLRYHKHTHLLFSLESLANLARNGRVKPAVAAVARMLGIRVIGPASWMFSARPAGSTVLWSALCWSSRATATTAASCRSLTATTLRRPSASSTWCRRSLTGLR